MEPPSSTESSLSIKWQIVPRVDVYFFRQNDNGSWLNLGVYVDEADIDPDNTRPILESGVYEDESQQWNISAWGDGTYYITNVGNGSSLNLDVHADGIQLFMSSNTNGSHLGQHWSFNSVDAISSSATVCDSLIVVTSSFGVTSTSTDEATPSTQTEPTSISSAATQYFATTTSFGTASTAAEDATSSTLAETPNSSSYSNSPLHGSGLSIGAKIGIGLGTAVAFLLLCTIMVIFCYRSRLHKHVTVTRQPQSQLVQSQFENNAGSHLLGSEFQKHEMTGSQPPRPSQVQEMLGSELGQPEVHEMPGSPLLNMK
ncbi:hypothetical protein V1509DRAFT_610664 [Lipomyces kononenkoae]